MKKTRPVKAWALIDSTGCFRCVRGAPTLHVDSWRASDAAERCAREEGGVIYRPVVVEIREVSPKRRKHK